jgi:hypothetical protein
MPNPVPDDDLPAGHPAAPTPTVDAGEVLSEPGTSPVIATTEEHA